MFDEDDEHQPSSMPPGFVAEIASGDRVKALTAVRDRLAAELGVAGGSAVASISRELRIILIELEQLGVRAEVSPLDRLADGVTANIADYRARRATGATGP
jgi:hypothetical protein